MKYSVWVQVFANESGDILGEKKASCSILGQVWETMHDSISDIAEQMNLDKDYLC